MGRRRRGLQNAEQRVDVSAQLDHFGAQLLPAGSADRIEARAPVGVRDSPLGFDESCALEPVEGLVERGVFDGEVAVAALVNDLGDAVAVERFRAERLEDQHVDGALQQAHGFFGHCLPHNVSTHHVWRTMGLCPAMRKSAIAVLATHSRIGRY